SATVASRSRYGTRSSTSRLLAQITPSLPGRRNSASGSARNRAAETSTAPSRGSSASSATWTNGSGEILPCLTSGINALPEWFDAEPLDGIDEQFVRSRPQRQIGLDNVLDHVGDVGVSHRRPDQMAEFGVLVGAAADGDLVKFLAVLLDAEDTDVADMVMAAGVDAAGNVD